MLRFGKENLISFFEVFGRIAKGYLVDGHGGSSCENDLFRLSIQKACESLSRFHDLGIHIEAKIIVSAMGVRGLVGVVLRDCLKDAKRLESG